MITISPSPPSTITIEYLHTLDKEQMVDLLQHKTDLLLTASRLKIPDFNYLKMLKQEVLKLQAAVAEFQQAEINSKL